MNPSLVFIFLNLFAISTSEPDTHIHVHLPPEEQNNTGVIREASPKQGVCVFDILPYALFEGADPDIGGGLLNPGADEGGLAEVTHSIG